ncbi:MAG: CoA transferase [Pseudomonadaceae bacterium]|nr:CoA transferase [Pseudomonadaceae bacterium]
MFERTGPLKDITIIDCTMALAGPFGTAMLADLGANVIKVEPPRGDGARPSPPLPPDYANVGAEESAGVDYGGYFASINRNKRSIVLDLKLDKDKETLLSLCEHADAIVENMRAGVMDKLGVGYDAVKTRNPAIVYGCIRGFGDPRTGESPYAQWPAYDIVAQAMSGHAHITGPEDGEGGYPSGVSVGDIYPGTLMALGVVSAIHNARATGEGQFFDVAMYDAMLAFCETVVCNYGYRQKSLGPRGQHHPNLMPFGIFPTSDGGVALACPGPNHWQLLCSAMGREDLVTDERCKNTYVRRRNQVFVEAQISAWTSSLSKQDVMQALGGKVPCGPVNTAEDIFNDPHVEARNMITRFQLPGDNPEVAIVGTPLKFTRTKAGFYRPPPRHGEHTEEVLKEFNITGQSEVRTS